MSMEARVAELERKLAVQAALLDMLRVEVLLHRAELAKSHWGSPGGIDTALPLLARVEHLLGQGNWPEGTAAVVRELAGYVSSLRIALEARDVTRASLFGGRVRDTCERLREMVERGEH